MASFATKIINLYSNFVNKKANVAFFFVLFFFCHDIAPYPTKKTYQKVVSNTG
jgi:hypothetical protein